MNEKQYPLKPAEVIAIIPAAGLASRLPGISSSKEMINIGTMPSPISNKKIPKPVCLYLIEKYKNAGIKKCFIILRKKNGISLNILAQAILLIWTWVI